MTKIYILKKFCPYPLTGSVIICHWKKMTFKKRSQRRESKKESKKKEMMRTKEGEG